MTPPNQIERRRSQLDLTKFWDALSAHALMDEKHHVENVAKMDTLSVDMRCIMREVTQFRKQYEPVLKSAKESSQQWADLRWTLIKALVVSGVLAGSGLICTAVWVFYIGGHLK